MNTTKEKLQLLKQWETNFYQIENAYELMKNAFDAQPESKVASASFLLFDAYTKCVSILVGDNNNSLDWYAWDNGMGKKKLKAKAVTWKTEKPISNLKILLKLIEDK